MPAPLTLAEILRFWFPLLNSCSIAKSPSQVFHSCSQCFDLDLSTFGRMVSLFFFFFFFFTFLVSDGLFTVVWLFWGLGVGVGGLDGGWSCRKIWRRWCLLFFVFAKRISPRFGVIFDTISVNVRWEQWCRWNCDLRFINARKQAFSVVPKASPRRRKSRAHMHTTSLWGVAAKWLVTTG